MDMELVQRQSQTVSPQLAQTMKLLQMNATELREYLENVSMENPVMELEVPEQTEVDETYLRKVQWLQKKNREIVVWQERVPDRDQRDYLDNIPLRYREEDSLAFFLKCQLASMRLGTKVEKAARWIIDNLDENGWYAGNGNDPFDNETMARALEAVQSMEPVGVGAADLRECLLIQLKRLPGDHALEVSIVSDYLEDVAKSHFNRIAKQISVSQEKVRQAYAEIMNLDPKPARGFDTPRDTAYIHPDIVVVKHGEELHIQLMEQDIPVVTLNDYYCAMLKNTQDTDVSTYLQEKVRQVRWIKQSITQRRSTIVQCMEVIVDMQRRFFLGGGELAPMVLRDVAERMEVNESTVSRAVRGKYLQCAYGLYPLSHFFARGIHEETEESVTANTVKNRIAELIANEDKRKPLSDQQLSSLLSDGGMTISRRTVAKYRAEMGLRPATGRRE